MGKNLVIKDRNERLIPLTFLLAVMLDLCISLALNLDDGTFGCMRDVACASRCTSNKMYCRPLQEWKQTMLVANVKIAEYYGSA